ncbi:MAG: glycogen/starch/alpha-glucan phosphorylase [Acidiphilium sp.]|nr:glycogen/starch/alpha-glucan phosphorylase [Acidiphilium sp.]MDD4936011.1 glycogen/starch/alpha-glucan phosphorylase [Acidiphilium sp.]
MRDVPVQDHGGRSGRDVKKISAEPPPLAPVRNSHDWREAIVAKLIYSVGKNTVTANDRDWFVALALALRDRVVERWIASTNRIYERGHKRVYYLSLEFLIGRLMFDTLTNLGMVDVTRAALAELGVDLDLVREAEPDAALGNGGLGRLAACFMESMATLAIPGYGYGIRYNNGLFKQAIDDGRQLEFPEDWLAVGNPWEFERAEVAYDIGFGGHVEAVRDDGGEVRQVWHPAEVVRAVAYDTPVVGWRGKHVNSLRLWSARAVDPLQLETFNAGDYVGALAQDVRAQSISRVLYPSDATAAGQELRLRQEYFFAAASLQDMLRRHLAHFNDLRLLPEKVAIQLNDTHPSIAVAELMRLLVDVHGLAWGEAWEITKGTFSYTNHTLLPEALETWPVPLMERMLPRQMQIIYLINADHLERVRALGMGSEDKLAGLSLIDETHGRRVRMGTLAFIGSHRINGVSALHTDLMRKTVFHDLHTMFPDRITNVTNGITFRRWLFEANPGLTRLLVEALGEHVCDDPSELTGLRGLVSDIGFRNRLIACRRHNKITLAKWVRERLRIRLDPDAMFDIHVKRIHEYKRQLLNILETIALYDAIRARPTAGWVPRVKIFAGKAAASYHQAKLIIKLINDVAKVINSDPTVRGLLKVVFLPNFNVSLAEMIIPAADLSEQISTAGMEASGTGNMKFALNGALTIGTLDGANVEIRDHVGAENIFIFGLTADEVAAHKHDGWRPRQSIGASPALAEVIDAVYSGVFSPGEPDRFHPIVHELRGDDRFLVTADFDAYAQSQRSVDQLWQNPEAWWRAAINNTAGMAYFSSDRAIGEYARGIWQTSGLETT